MNKPLAVFLTFILFSSAAVWAQDGKDRGYGGGSGYSDNNGNGHPKKGKRNGRNQRGANRANNPARNNGSTAPHQFNQNGANHPAGAVQNPNHAMGQGVQAHSFSPQSQKISQRFQKMGIKSIPRPIARQNILTADAQHSTFTRPAVGPAGESLHASVIEPRGANAVVVQNHMNTFTHNATFSAQINVYNTNETVANHYYWHNWGGYNYCHYYDPWGYHWYGWYWGGHCFWNRWYGGNWWWYDPVYFRWCYWHDGGWWWQDPQANVIYVYNNGQYETTTTTTTVTQGAPSNAPAPSGEGAAPSGQAPGPSVSYSSKDGSRMVKISGGDAFLYDTALGDTDNKPFYLASGVKEVKFSNGQDGKPLQILAIFNDGSFQMFDADGNPANGGSNPSGN